MADKKKPFIKTPKLIGGNEGFRKFIKENLVYPKEALRNSIEGTVFIKFNVNQLGEISEVTVEKGIGYGCDEEAIRLVYLLQYEKVNNRGIRLLTTLKVRIKFILPKEGNSISYTIKKKTDEKGDLYTYSLLED